MVNIKLDMDISVTLDNEHVCKCDKQSFFKVLIINKELYLCQNCFEKLDINLRGKGEGNYTLSIC
mgnify:CR=1 FL=1|jgi:hypothetical protein